MLRLMKIAVTMFVLCVAAVAFWLHRFPVHEHCIKCAASSLQLYAASHQGRFPYNTNGFGDALVSLVTAEEDTNAFTIKIITGVGDDGQFFRAGLTNGSHVAESNCSRIYIQGLTDTNSPEIAILFDAYQTRGGDHVRVPWRPLMREVCFASGDVQFMRETSWPKFSSNQIELLVKEGIPRTRAEEYYRLASVKPWKF